MKLLITAVVAATLLSGCNIGDREAELRANPKIVPIGVIDGCNVKYVDRGYASDSFYISVCQPGVTASAGWTIKSGKSTTQRSSITVTKEIEQLQAEKDAIDARSRAMEKLTPAERAALGIN